MNSHRILVPTNLSVFEEKGKEQKESTFVGIRRFSHRTP